MDADIRVYNSSGQLQFAASDYLGRVIGTIAVSADGSYTWTGAMNGRQLFAAFSVDEGFSGTSFAFAPDVTTSGSTINWSYAGTPVATGRIVYGVF